MKKILFSLFLLLPIISFSQTYFTYSSLTGYQIFRGSLSDLRAYLYIDNPTFSGIDTPIIGLRAGYSNNWAKLIADTYLDHDVLISLPIYSGRILLENGFNPIFVSDPFTVLGTATMQYNAFHLKNSSGYFISGILNNSDTSELRLTDPYSITSFFYSSLRQRPLFSNQYFYLPSKGGDLATNSSGFNSQSLFASTVMTVGHGQNFIPTSIQFTPTSFLPSGGQWKISNITSVSFDINFSIPQTGTFSGYFFCTQ